MSETKRAKTLPTTNYIVFGKYKDLELNATGKEQPAVNDIPLIPMEINVESHTFEIAPNGEIIRKGMNGEKLPGVVKNKDIKKALEGRKEGR